MKKQMDNKLNFKKINENEDLVSKPTFRCIQETFSQQEINDIFVAEINPDFMTE